MRSFVLICLGIRNDHVGLDRAGMDRTSASPWNAGRPNYQGAQVIIPLSIWSVQRAAKGLVGGVNPVSQPAPVTPAPARGTDCKATRYDERQADSGNQSDVKSIHGGPRSQSYGNTTSDTIQLAAGTVNPLPFRPPHRLTGAMQESRSPFLPRRDVLPCSRDHGGNYPGSHRGFFFLVKQTVIDLIAAGVWIALAVLGGTSVLFGVFVWLFLIKF